MFTYVCLLFTYYLLVSRVEKVPEDLMFCHFFFAENFFIILLVIIGFENILQPIIIQNLDVSFVLVLHSAQKNRVIFLCILLCLLFERTVV